MTPADDVPPTVPAAVRRSAALWPGDEAVVEGDERLTYAELADRMTLVGRALVASGVEPGDRVAVWAPNSLAFIVAAMGGYACGAVLLPVNTRFTGPEAAHVLRSGGARLLITVTDFLEKDYLAALAEADPRLAAELDVVALSGPAGEATGWPDFLRRAERVDVAELAAREEALGPEHPSDIIFTSGTTGKPKGAVLSHGASTRTYVEWSRRVGLRHGDRYLVVYPFFHAAGLKSAVLACILSGATVLPCPVFAVDTVMELVQAERVTMLPGPPTLFQSLLDADLSGYDRSSLRLAVTGAAVVPVDLVRRMHDELGFESVGTGYGLTETTGTVSVTSQDDPIEVVAATSGRPLPGVAVRVVDREGRELPPGVPGEVLAKGFNIMLGYHGDPVATAETIDAQGWLHTGDIGVVDEAGNVRITDRIKDMYIVGGFNVHPAEVENGILGHPAIAQVAVVGAPDERLGEVGCAFVVLRRGASLTAAELIAFCRERMANFKVPRHVEIVDVLPLNRTGKVEKVELRSRAARVAAPRPQARA
jgi:acyl-CoA synthetase (AMP-forming)/AMP-acid ligase II